MSGAIIVTNEAQKSHTIQSFFVILNDAVDAMRQQCIYFKHETIDSVV